ncbi:MAG TPA: glycosyltransferase family 4 protein [Flavobacterium sp.]|jgi:glycosyltransferase involved in cell wall biosynthesis
MEQQKKILFLGETYRADAITWINGLKEFGHFDIITWELKRPSTNLRNRIGRMLEFALALSSIKKLIRKEKPHMIIAERTTSYGFLAALTGMDVIVIAQQGRTDLWPESSVLYPLKKAIQRHAFIKATMIHAWGPVMTISMKASGVDMKKVMVLPKGINLKQFTKAENQDQDTLHAIVTRSLSAEYRHNSILKAFGALHQQGIDFMLTIVGTGGEMENLKALAVDLNIAKKVFFTGRISNTHLPALLQQSNLYLSMPITEGVSASLFEAMASGCYPIVSDIPGNQSWIRHRENGQLVPIDDYNALAAEIIWANDNTETRKRAVDENRQFIEQHVNYHINMAIIAQKYHQLINGHVL